MEHLIRYNYGCTLISESFHESARTTVGKLNYDFFQLTELSFKIRSAGYLLEAGLGSVGVDPSPINIIGRGPIYKSSVLFNWIGIALRSAALNAKFFRDTAFRALTRIEKLSEFSSETNKLLISQAKKELSAILPKQETNDLRDAIAHESGAVEPRNVHKNPIRTAIMSMDEEITGNTITFSMNIFNNELSTNVNGRLSNFKLDNTFVEGVDRIKCMIF